MNRLRTAELSTDVVWHGHSRDVARLVESALANCKCLSGAPTGGVAPLCSAHEILADQHTLDHLAFARSVRARLVDEEWRQPTASAVSLDSDDWAALLAAPAVAPPARVRHRRKGWRKLARSPLILSLVALLLLVAIGAPGETLQPSTHSISSWHTR
jgi:hypothetical protein